MRALLVLMPIVLVGGFAIHQAVSGPEVIQEKPAKASKRGSPALAPAAAVPAVPPVPAIPRVPAAPVVPAIPDLEGLSRLATLSEEIERRVPRAAIARATRVANELRLRAEAHEDVEATLNEAMLVLEEQLSELDGADWESLEDLGLSATFFADLAASIRASVTIEMEDRDRVVMKTAKTRRQ